EGVFTGRPGDRAVRAERDVIDPAALWVLPDHARLAGCVERDDLAVVAAGDEAITVTRAREDAAVMHGDAPLGRLLRRQQHRFLAQHESRNLLEEMRGDDRRAGGASPCMTA